MAEAELATVARPYARAIFSSALSAKGNLIIGRRYSPLVAVSTDKSGREILNSPGLYESAKTKFFESVLTGRLDVEAKNLISLLAGVQPGGSAIFNSGNIRADESTPSKNPGG